MVSYNVHPEIWAIIYTTNAIECLNTRFRRAVKARGHFPNEQPAPKSLFPGHPKSGPDRSNTATVEARIERLYNISYTASETLPLYVPVDRRRDRESRHRDCSFVS